MHEDVGDNGTQWDDGEVPKEQSKHLLQSNVVSTQDRISYAVVDWEVTFASQCVADSSKSMLEYCVWLASNGTPIPITLMHKPCYGLCMH